MCHEYMVYLITLRSESDTPKSRLEIKSFALPSASPIWAPSSCSSNKSCCHLSGNSLGCGRQHNLRSGLCFTPLLKRPSFNENRRQKSSLNGERQEIIFVLSWRDIAQTLTVKFEYTLISWLISAIIKMPARTLIRLMLLTWPLDKKGLDDSSHLEKKVHLNQGHFHTLTSGCV